MGISFLYISGGSPNTNIGSPSSIAPFLFLNWNSLLLSLLSSYVFVLCHALVLALSYAPFPLLFVKSPFSADQRASEFPIHPK